MQDFDGAISHHPQGQSADADVQLPVCADMAAVAERGDEPKGLPKSVVGKCRLRLISEQISVQC